MSELDQHDDDPLDVSCTDTWTPLGGVADDVVTACRPTPTASDVWDGNLTPTPPSKAERDMLAMLARMMEQPHALQAAIRRFGFIREALGLGLGMDPDLVNGVAWWLEALLALEARRSRGTRPGPSGRSARHVRLDRGRASTAALGVRSIVGSHVGVR